MDPEEAMLAGGGELAGPDDQVGDGVLAPIDAVVSVELEKCVSRLDESEKRITTVSSELQKVQTDLELAPRVASLVDALKQVAPKVMDQEQSLRELHEKVGRLEASRSAAAVAAPAQGAASVASTDTAVRARVSKLEVDFA